MTTRLRPSLCPRCGYLLDAASSPKKGRATPKSGDVSVCMSCCEVLMFDEALVPTRVDPTALATMLREDRRLRETVARVRTAIRQMWAMNPERREELDRRPLRVS